MLEIFRRSSKKEIAAPVSNINTLTREGNDLFSDTLILLDESLSGNLFCAEQIVVEQNGVLSGNITSKSCIVSGTITGNIVSTDQMDIKSTAIIKGNIKSALINIEPGAVINGRITVAEDTAAVAKLSEKLKVHSERDLQDKLYPGIPELNGEEQAAETVKLNWEFKSSVDLDKINLDKLKTDVQPGLELPELNWTTNTPATSLFTPVEKEPATPVKKEEEIVELKPEEKPALLAATEKNAPAPTSEVKDEDAPQRWW